MCEVCARAVCVRLWYLNAPRRREPRAEQDAVSETVLNGVENSGLPACGAAALGN